MEGKYIAGIAAILVAVILVGSVLAPVIDTVSGGAWDETVTTTYNEDPDLQFDKQTSDFALNMSVTIGDDVVITNGEDTVTAPYGAMFLLAADNSAVFISVADDLIFTWSDNDGKHSLTLAGDFTAVIADGKLTINDGTAHDVPLPASYLYVPSSTGGYGSFASGELAKRAADPVIAAGSFAGAVAYNSSVTLVGDAMVMSVDGTDTFITSAEWVAAPEAEPAVVPFDPSSITIQPLDPSVIDPIDLGGGASLMAVPTPTYTDGDWGYDLITGYNGTFAKIVSYSGAGGGAITIPATVGGYDVKEVGKGDGISTVFETTLSATDLIISSGITKLNDGAFLGCSGFTGSLTLPNSIITFEPRVFKNCSGFTGSLVIPNGVTSTPQEVFRGCSGFTSLTLSNSLTTIGSSAFSGCSNMTGSLVIPNGVTSIVDSAFSNCTGFTSLTLPNSLTTIGYNAFNGCTGFTSLTLPNSLTTIGDSAFNNCTGFTGSLVIPDGITVIGEKVFYKCSGFTGSLVIPDGITQVKKQAFYSCSGFTSLTLPNSLTTIGDSAFSNCSNMTGSLVIPDSVTSIGSTPFYQCKFTSLITMMDEGSTLQSNTFSSTSRMKEVLNLGTLELTATSNGLNANVVQDYIGADVYLAPATITEVIHHSGGGGGGMGAMYAAIPVVILAAILLAAVSMFVIRRGM